MNRNVIWLVVIGVILVGGFIFRDRLSGNASQLAVGDCFALPTSAEETVEDVQHNPCTEAHGGEVFFVGKSSASKDTAYPSDAELSAEVFGLCDPAFASYTGKDSNTDPEWTYGYFIPTAEGWKDGDRGVICYAAKIDGSSTTGSIKKN